MAYAALKGRSSTAALTLGPSFAACLGARWRLSFEPLGDGHGFFEASRGRKGVDRDETSVTYPGRGAVVTVACRYRYVKVPSEDGSQWRKQNLKFFMAKGMEKYCKRRPPQ